MRAAVQVVVAALVVVVVAVAAGGAYLVTTGLKAQPEPGAMETRVARTIRGFAIPREVKARSNPIGTSTDELTPGLEHFARYCAMCHANDGSGEGAAIGRGLFPKPPDMRAEATQNLTDGEMFYIIENGVRFTGMPAFGTGKPDPAGEKQVWQLVRFIRHVPKITPDEIDRMKSLNPL
jgi:mono/diheme cytochrome c family protein